MPNEQAASPLIAALALAAPLWAAAPPVGAGPARLYRIPGPPPVSEPAVVAFSPDGRALAAGCRRGGVHLFDTKSGKGRALLVRSRGDWPVEGIVFSPDGKVLAAHDGSISLFAPQDGKRFPLVGGLKWAVSHFTFLPGGQLAAWCGKEHLYLIDPKSGKHRLAARLVGRRHGRMRGLAARGDGAVVMLWSSWSVGVADLATGKVAISTLPGERDKARGGFIGPNWTGQGLPPITDALLTPGGRGCLAHLYPGVFLPAVGWAPGAGGPRRLQHLDQAPNGFAPAALPALGCSPSGRVAAVAGTCGAIYLCDLGEGRLVAAAESSAGRVAGFAFSPCGRFLAVARYERPAVEVRDIDGMLGKLPPCATAADRARRWAELSSADARTGQRALAALARHAEADKLAEGRLVLTEAGRRRVERLVRDLDADEPERREGAHKALAALGQAAGPAVRRALAAKPSAEARRRLTALVGSLDGPAAWGRHGRALDLLERRATPAAARVLKAVAAEKDGGWFSLEAGEALARMKPRLALKP